MLQAIDFTSVHLYTDLYGLGDVQSQITFSAEYLQSHLEVASSLRKPLIITEFGKLPPLPDRNAFFSYIYGLAEASVKAGGPLAGESQSSLCSKIFEIRPASWNLTLAKPFVQDQLIPQHTLAWPKEHHLEPGRLCATSYLLLIALKGPCSGHWEHHL